ncbi:MAG: ATP-binding protein [Deltaproteobacteria bacterium]|nr:ATP-binding protein [Deltaproteobacteria bacterium]MBW2326799.1 ATP-binding protein [Deltaproteobacteria bacterium]
MQNPFAYSNYVIGESFCNREEELSELFKYIKGSQNVLLFSHRRYGKSSLIRQVIRDIQKKNLKIGTMHVELYGTISEKDFISRIFQSLNQMESNLDRLLKSFGNALKNINLNLSIDPATGVTSVSPSFGVVNEKIFLEELMNILSKYSQKRKLVIALDEFQEIANYSEEGFEKRLRALVQQHSNICYIFSGSQRHLITEMFNSTNRAFYKLADSFPLYKIETKHYIPWVQNLFGRKNIHMDAGLIEEIVARFENHPMYIQNFLFHLWDEPAEKGFAYELIDKIENSIIEKRSLEYTVLWETLSINQKKTLKLILLNDGTNLFNADALKSVNLKTGSLVTKALSSLINKEIIIKNGKYMIQDVVFKKWLQKTLSV